jgi:hypothetical protein
LRQVAGTTAIHFQAGHFVSLALRTNLRVVVLRQDIPFFELPGSHANRNEVWPQNPQLSHRRAGDAFEFSHRHRDAVERVGTPGAGKLQPRFGLGDFGHRTFTALPPPLRQFPLGAISGNFRIGQRQFVHRQQSVKIRAGHLDGEFRLLAVEYRVAVRGLHAALLVTHETVVVEQGLP